MTDQLPLPATQPDTDAARDAERAEYFDLCWLVLATYPIRRIWRGTSLRRPVVDYPVLRPYRAKCSTLPIAAEQIAVPTEQGGGLDDVQGRRSYLRKHIQDRRANIDITLRPCYVEMQATIHRVS